MWLFYFLFWITVSVIAREPLYRKIGDKVVLTPDSVVNPINNIVWTHGPSIAIEWFRSGDETSSYRHFKDRGRLNTLTGALTITGLTPDDSGNYTVEINNKVTSKTELLIISPVSKPTLSSWCEPKMTYCVLTCNGDTTDAEPVTYWWTSGDTTWPSTKELTITKKNSELWLSWFSCAFENPVSFSSSKKVRNPFKREPLYRKIGDKVVLTPDSVVKPINSIAWKHGPDFAMVWHRYGDETFAHRHFKDRGSLNISTGALTITGLTPDDSGIYTVEINDRVTSKIELLVISPVSKPTISSWCDPEMIYCVLTCNGDTTGAEPVTYRWTSGDTTLSSTKEHTITKKDKQYWFSCAFENPVSNISSDKVSNPFMEKYLTWIYSLIPLFVFLVACFIIIIIILINKRRKETKALLSVSKNPPTQDQILVVQDTRNGTEMSEMLPPVKKTSTQDPTSVVVQDPSDETETSPMIPDNAETRC